MTQTVSRYDYASLPTMPYESSAFILQVQTWISGGMSPVLTIPKAGLTTSTTARIWQKYIMSAMVWKVS